MTISKVGYAILFALAIVALALEASVFSHITWRGIQPNLTLIYTVTVGLAFGPEKGAVVGFFAGFLQDVYSGRFLGVYGVCHLIAGYVAGQSTIRVFKENLWLPLGMAAVATVIADSLAFVLFWSLGVRLALSIGFVSVLVPGTVLNALIAPFVYGPILRLRSHVTQSVDQ